ncbi:hypothetical protein FGIG_09874 [Fasciola gigantica]|uniref:Uncharacterized protein n=1 Tax=Fasciola gigantica TaxID=46835 RepID=A0A504ZBF6_FASGI|nr:hypothetical protein FGIG_09874 [Fasciola gigantica]
MLFRNSTFFSNNMDSFGNNKRVTLTDIPTYFFPLLNENQGNWINSIARSVIYVFYRSFLSEH